jgi:ubiquinone biosynthesis protein COQ9
VTDATAFDREAAAETILQAAIVHVPFDGWTLDVLQRAAEEAGYDRVTALRVFPRGPVEAVATWCALADRQMLAELDAHDLTSLKTRARVALAVRLRFEALSQRREAVRRAVALLALPLNAGSAATTLWRTVDAIWYAAGDTATDFNYYTKRALLAGVYSATLLYWLEDRSEGSADTWSFLDRRIADALSVPATLAGFGRRLGDLPDMFRRFASGASARR